MNPLLADILVGSIVIILVGLIIFKMVKDYQKGKAVICSGCQFVEKCQSEKPRDQCH